MRLLPATSVAPVEVAGPAPETLFLRYVLLGRPGVRRSGLLGDRRLLTVHRFLEPGLLFGLEQRMVLERILVFVPIEWPFALELGVALLELEMVLDHLCEQRRCLHRDRSSPGFAQRRPILARS